MKDIKYRLQQEKKVSILPGKSCCMQSRLQWLFCKNVQWENKDPPFYQNRITHCQLWASVNVTHKKQTLVRMPIHCCGQRMKAFERCCSMETGDNIVYMVFLFSCYWHTDMRGKTITSGTLRWMIYVVGQNCPTEWCLMECL